MIDTALKQKSYLSAKFYKNIIFAAIILLFAQGCGKGGSGTAPQPVKPPTVDPVLTVTPTTANFEKLLGWNKWKTSHINPYNLVIIGDSYTQGNFFTWQFRGKMLGDGHVDGGPGYCSFGRWDPVELYSIDSSIDPAELTFTYDPLKWVSDKVNTYGPCDYITNNSANAVISVKSTVSLNSITILFEKHPTSGDFRYRVNGGAWTTASAVNAKQGFGSVAVDVSGAGDNINLDIEPRQAGEIFFGVLGNRTGNVLTIDKVGSTGATADMFAQNDIWKASINALSPNGVVIMFGINEMDNNVTPAQMKINLQNIITKVKEVSPNVDIMLMCPPQTAFEKESPRLYKTADYADAIYKLAVENNAAFVNFEKVFGPFSQASVTSGLMNEDRIHPGDKGGDLIATTMFNAFKK